MLLSRPKPWHMSTRMWPLSVRQLQLVVRSPAFRLPMHRPNRQLQVLFDRDFPVVPATTRAGSGLDDTTRWLGLAAVLLLVAAVVGWNAWRSHQDDQQNDNAAFDSGIKAAYAANDNRIVNGDDRDMFVPNHRRETAIW